MGELRIDSAYWAEKVRAESILGNGVREFSPEQFRANVKSYWEEYFEGHIGSNEAVGVWEEIKAQVLSAEDSEIDMVSKLIDFNIYGSDFEFYDFWESSCNVKTYNFIWCCYAIAWGVIQYDKFKEKLK